VEALGRSGTVNLRTALREGWVVLSVEDDGAGISSEAQAHVFQPFFSTKGPAHAGLGLSLASCLAARSGGSVRLSSEPERGTCVELMFPQAEKPAPEKPPAEKAPPGPGPRVLVVDDEEAVRRILGRLLSEAGCRVTLAEHAEGALSLLRIGGFDLLLTDWIMPGMDGLALARTVKDQKPGFPVVLCTGRATQHLEAAREEGWLDRILPKPVDFGSLQKAVAELTSVGK
jgi:two-component system cell cycle sensor histidine kinase/response regulator CckA